MTPPPALLDLGVNALRAITLRTGAMIGAVIPVAYGLATRLSAVVFGRPAIEGLAGEIAAMAMQAVVGAIIGGGIGWIVHRIVSATSIAGPTDRHVVRRAVVTAVVIAAAVGVQFTREVESRSRPRVMYSDPTVMRLPGDSPSPTRSPAIRIFSVSQDGEAPGLKWRNRPVAVALSGAVLTISQSTGLVDRIDLDGLDYVKEIVATTGSLDGSREWLAMLLRLRSTGRRELLLIYDPAGVRVRQELVARTTKGTAPVLWTAGEPGGPEEFLLNVGEPIRYILGK